MNGHAFLDHCIYDNADVVKRAFKEGHQIAAHTWSHPHLPLLSEDEIRYQIDSLEVAFKKIIGTVPTYFRPPFGEQNELVQKAGPMLFIAGIGLSVFVTFAIDAALVINFLFPGSTAS